MKIFIEILLLIAVFLSGTFAGIIFWDRCTDRIIKNIQETALESCKIRLEDPHHCISVCVEQFEKMGC